MNSLTIDPQLVNLNLFYKKEFYKTATNFLDAVQSYSNELEIAMSYNQAKVSNDVITSTTNFFVNLDSTLKQVQPQFAAYWIKQFNRSLDEIKNQVFIKNNGTGVFYRNFSDAIGSITRIENYFDDSTQLVSDVNSQVAPPLRYGSSLTNKINSYGSLLNAELSKKTNIVFRKNIFNIQPQVSTGKQANGDNLVPDVLHAQRMIQNIPSLNQKVQNEFKELYNVIYFYCFYNSRLSSNNIQFVPNINITVDVEGQALNQDALFDQLKDMLSNKTSQKVLGVS